MNREGKISFELENGNGLLKLTDGYFERDKVLGKECRTSGRLFKFYYNRLHYTNYYNNTFYQFGQFEKSEKNQLVWIRLAPEDTGPPAVNAWSTSSDR